MGEVISKIICPVTAEKEQSRLSMGELVDWLLPKRDAFRKTLLQEGVIVFRGFPVHSASDFEQFARALDPELASYHGQTDREHITGKVYESAPTPRMWDMKLHSETAYANYFPSRGFFYCSQPAERGGETLFSDNRELLKRLPPELLDRFRSKRVHYIRNIPPDSSRRVRALKSLNSGIVKGWQEMFGTDDRSRVEALCRERHLEFRWLDRGWLSLSATLPATRLHRETGEEVWFNQAHVVHVSRRTQGSLIAGLNWLLNLGLENPLFGCRYGDGAEFDESDLLRIREIQRASAQSLLWEKGDVAMFDNLLVAHGRNPFRGQRKLLAVFSGYQTGDGCHAS